MCVYVSTLEVTPAGGLAEPNFENRAVFARRDVDDAALEERLRVHVPKGADALKDDAHLGETQQQRQL